jgi:hypothetical protein
VVAPVDNLTRLTGTLRDRRPHPSLGGWELVALDVQEVEPVPGRADLLSRRRGETLEVAVPSATLAGAEPGGRVSVRARLTPRGVMSEPHRP